MPQSNESFKVLLQFVALVALSMIAFACKNKNNPTYLNLYGKALGQDYHIIIKANDSISLIHSIDSIFSLVEKSMSLQLPESTLSRYNQAHSAFCYSKDDDAYFSLIFAKAKEIYLSSQGAFNPAVEPLIQYYGFSDQEIRPLKKEDSTVIHELLKLVVFDSILIADNQDTVCITKPGKDIKLTFNAISPGFAVDILASYFEGKNLKDYSISLGSEYKSMGLNPQNASWIMGIERPEAGEKDRRQELLLQLSNKAMVTNGNYQKMYEVNGQKYSHIISPFTGISHPTDILSVTVIADDCTTADAYATAFMVLGLEKSLTLTEQLKNIEACFIYDSDRDDIYEYKVSRGFSKYYLNNEQK